MGKRRNVSGALGIALVVFMLVFGLGACEQLLGPDSGNDEPEEFPDDVMLAAGGTIQAIDTVMRNMPADIPDEGDIVYDDGGITATVVSISVESVDEETDYIEGTIFAEVTNFVCETPDDTDLIANGTFALEIKGIHGQQPSEMAISANMEFTANGRTITAIMSASVVGENDVTGTLTVNGVEYDMADIIEHFEGGNGGETEAHTLALYLERPEDSPEGNHRLWVDFYSDSARTDLLHRDGPYWLGTVNGEGNYGDPHTVNDIPAGVYYVTVYVSINAPDGFAPAYAYELPDFVHFDRNRDITVAAGQWHAPQFPDDLLGAAAGMFHIVGLVMESVSEENLNERSWDIEENHLWVDVEFVDDKEPPEEAELKVLTNEYSFESHDPELAVGGQLDIALSFQDGELFSVGISGYVIFRFSDTSEVHAGIDGTATDFTGDGPQTISGTFEYEQPLYNLSYIVDDVDL